MRASNSCCTRRSSARRSPTVAASQSDQIEEGSDEPYVATGAKPGRRRSTDSSSAGSDRKLGAGEGETVAAMAWAGTASGEVELLDELDRDPGWVARPASDRLSFGDGGTGKT